MSSKDSIDLRALRERRGMTQAELGRRAGMPAAAVSHFETGLRTPALGSLVRLADALDTSVDALLGRAPVEVDPIFVQASKASPRTLATIRRVTAALLADLEPGGEGNSGAAERRVR